jgi:hypothetical protein
MTAKLCFGGTKEGLQIKRIAGHGVSSGEKKAPIMYDGGLFDLTS